MIQFSNNPLDNMDSPLQGQKNHSWIKDVNFGGKAGNPKLDSSAS